MIEGNAVYLLVAFLLSVLILAGYLLSLAARTNDARRALRRRETEVAPRDPTG